MKNQKAETPHTSRRILERTKFRCSLKIIDYRYAYYNTADVFKLCGRFLSSGRWWRCGEANLDGCDKSWTEDGSHRLHLLLDARVVIRWRPRAPRDRDNSRRRRRRYRSGVDQWRENNVCGLSYRFFFWFAVSRIAQKVQHFLQQVLRGFSVLKTLMSCLEAGADESASDYIYFSFSSILSLCLSLTQFSQPLTVWFLQSIII